MENRCQSQSLQPRQARIDVPDAPAEVDALDLLGPAASLDLAGRQVPVLTLEQQLLVASVELTAHPVPPLARAGLAQRVLGRRQPTSAGPAGAPALSTTTASPSGPVRAVRSTRR